MRVAVLAFFLVACDAPAWRVVAPQPGAVYRYLPPIERYAPDDPGLWIVTAREDSPDGRARLAGALADRDDVLGDGFVAWLTNERAAWWRRHPEVAAVVPLQPADRIAPAIAAAPAADTVAVRVDLADAASDAQRDAVVAWLAARGGRAAPAGTRTLDVELPARIARELAALGPVRWVERRAR
jgi:hypothetical protein